jgi:porphobilinogen synthase
MSDRTKAQPATTVAGVSDGLGAPGDFPRVRHRRKRLSPWIQSLSAENSVTTDDLVWPVFVHDGSSAKIEIPSMPEIYRYSGEQILREAERAANLGIRALALFPVLEQARRSEDGDEALNEDSFEFNVISRLTAEFPDLGIFTDVALDRYTTHGQDGVIRSGAIANDETVELLCRQSVLHARAGAHFVAPSDMMDGRVLRIREALDAEGYSNVGILAYSAKYASRFYGPFRDAVDSATGFGASLGFAGKQTYHMNPANGLEALREVASDLAEGADIVMVKPGLPYLDIIHSVKQTFGVPTFAYHVSGEYAMLAAAAKQGWLDFHATLMETMLCFKRAGADAVLTYAACAVAEKLRRT